MSSATKLRSDRLFGAVFARCPRCGGVMDLVGEAYKAEGRGYVAACFTCSSCGARYCLELPFVEVRG